MNRIQRSRTLISAAALCLAATTLACDSSGSTDDSGGSLVTSEDDVAGEERRFGRTRLKSIEYVPPNVVVEGTTDLPDGSILSISLGSVDVLPPPSGPPTQDVETRDGRFVASIRPPDRPAFEADDRYGVGVSFKSHRQPPEVEALVGARGENLKRKHYESMSSVNTRWTFLLTSTEVFLHLAPPAADPPFASASSYPHGTPEHFLALFVEAWKERRWGEMARTNKIPVDAPPDTYRDFLEDRSVRGFKIIAVDRSEGSAQISFRLWSEPSYGPEIEKDDLTIHVFREMGFNGRLRPWGLDPFDLMRLFG